MTKVKHMLSKIIAWQYFHPIIVISIFLILGLLSTFILSEIGKSGHLIAMTTLLILSFVIIGFISVATKSVTGIGISLVVCIYAGMFWFGNFLGVLGSLALRPHVWINEIISERMTLRNNADLTKI